MHPGVLYSFVLRLLRQHEAPQLTYRHGFYGECSSNFSSRLQNHSPGPFSCFSLLRQNKQQQGKKNKKKNKKNPSDSIFPQSQLQAQDLVQGLRNGWKNSPAVLGMARRISEVGFCKQFGFFFFN